MWSSGFAAALASVLGLDKAHSAEFVGNTPHPVIDLMPDQEGVVDKGGTMRLGAYPCQLAPGSIAHRLYGANRVWSRL